MPAPSLEAEGAEDGRTGGRVGGAGVVTDVTEFVRREKKFGREGVDVWVERLVSEELVNKVELERLFGSVFFDAARDGPKWSQMR